MSSPAPLTTPPPPATASVRPPPPSSSSSSAAIGSSTPHPSVSVPGKKPLSPAMFNAFRLAAAVDRLSSHLQGSYPFQPTDIYNLCFTLARGIDYALTNKDIPSTASKLPSVLKQVYQCRNDTTLQSAITVLMISVKDACKKGWFQTSEAEELLNMANELCSSFCMEVSATTEADNALDTILKVLGRFYPKLKFGRLLVSFEAKVIPVSMNTDVSGQESRDEILQSKCSSMFWVDYKLGRSTKYLPPSHKPGYDILMADFIIQKNISPDENILLFVVQTDNLETSSCIISPPHVSFLVNGKGVERRTNVSQDSGPQFPTDITKMLKYGTNILQAAGYFTGNYLIAITYFSKEHLPNAPVFKDYVQPIVATLDSDSEIVEGSSRISLNCPISFKRIKNPVKGHLCKHHQCFDYDNFMEMNSRKPSWRCPCCNQPTCFVDLRVDRNMFKILREVEEDVDCVVLSADGSWKVAAEHSGCADQPHNMRPTGQEDSVIKCQPDKSADSLTDAVDLTMEDNISEVTNISAHRNEPLTWETQDKKPVWDVHGLPVSQFLSETLIGSGTTVTTQPVSSQVNNAWSGFLSSASAVNRSAVPNGSDVHIDQVLEPMFSDTVTTPASQAQNRDPISSFEFSQHALRFRQGENMQLQQSQFGNSVISSEVERPPIPRNVTRNPIAIQALPVQLQTSIPTRRMRTNLPNPIPNIPNTSFLPSSQPIVSDGFSAIARDLDMHDASRTSEMQNRDYQDRHQIRNSSVQQVVGLAAPNLIGTRVQSDQQRGVGACRASSQPSSEHQNPNIHPPNVRTHHTMSQPTTILSQSSRIPSAQAQPASHASTTGSMGSIHSLGLATRLATARMQAGTVNSQTSRMTPSIPNQRAFSILETSGSDHLRPTSGFVPATARADSVQEPSAQNWRPTGRMRGSLTGNAYSAALNQYMVSSSQPMPARPSSSPDTTIPDQSPVIVGNLNP